MPATAVQVSNDQVVEDEGSKWPSRGDWVLLNMDAERGIRAPRGPYYTIKPSPIAGWRSSAAIRLAAQRVRNRTTRRAFAHLGRTRSPFAALKPLAS